MSNEIATVNQQYTDFVDRSCKLIIKQLLSDIYTIR